MTKIDDNTNAGVTTTPVMMFSVPDFCRAHSISKSMLYKEVKANRGPRLSKCGARTLISVDAAAEWRRELERQAA